MSASRRSATVWCLVVAMSMNTLLSGCSRSFWRRQGEKDAYNAVSEKVTDYRWAVPRYGIKPDPRSRFYDPYDPDKSPLPPDDPAAHTYMHWMDGKEGYKGWHELGQELSVENPDWLSAFGLSSLDGQIVPIDGGSRFPKLENLTLKDALELSYIHSREYQTEIENVYLAALALTAQRFEFGVRYLGGFGEPFVDGDAVSVPDGRNSFGLSSGMGIRQLLPSGAQWIVELTNNTLWVFSNGSSTSSASTLSYSIVQPLFLGAGRKVVLESLTQAERNVLYAIRDLARFRKEFFTDTVAGGSGFLSLLQQAQTIDNQIFNLRLLNDRIERTRASAAQLPNRTSTDLSELPDGFETPIEFVGRLGHQEGDGVRPGRLYWRGPMTRDELQAIRALSTDRQYLEAVAELERILFAEIRQPLERLPEGFAIPEALAEGERLRFDAATSELVWRGPLFNSDADEFEGMAARYPELSEVTSQMISRLAPEIRNLQLAQLQNRLARDENSLRDAQRRYRDLVDSFKLQLGLPTDMEVSIDRSLLDPFILIAPELLEIENQIKPFIRDEIRRINPDAPEMATFRDVVRRLRELQSLVGKEGFSLVNSDLQEVRSIVDANQSGSPPRGVRQIFDDETLNRLALEIEQDERQLDNIESSFRRQGVLIDQLEVFAALDDFESLLKSLDTQNQDGKVDVNELPDVWDNFFRARADINADGSVDQREMVVTLMKSMLQINEEMLRVTQSLLVIQIGLRAEKVPLNIFRLPEGDVWPSMERCVEIGLENRLDLMNSRAEVMDSRRLVEVAANRLEAVLDVVVDGDIASTSSESPVDFRGDLGSFRAGFRFTAPVDLITERNAYNTSLVNYQRRRRAYMLFEDQVKLQIRQSYRQLDVLRINVENDRKSVRLSAQEYDQAAEQATRTDTNALNLLNALNGILTAQNSLIRDWVNYEGNRLNIFRDMGIMEIDPRGIWYDDFYQPSDSASQPSPPSPVIPPAPIDDVRVEQAMPVVASADEAIFLEPVVLRSGLDESTEKIPESEPQLSNSSGSKPAADAVAEEPAEPKAIPLSSDTSGAENGSRDEIKELEVLDRNDSRDSGGRSGGSPVRASGPSLHAVGQGED